MSDAMKDEGGFEKVERRVGRHAIKSFLPRSLLGRSLLILITPVLLIQIVTTLMFFDRHWSKMTARLAYAVSGEIAMVVELLEDGRDFDKTQFYADRYLGLAVDYERDGVLHEEDVAKGLFLWEGLVVRTLRRELEGQLQRPFALHLDFSEKQVMVRIALDHGVLVLELPERRLFSSSGYVFLLWVFGSSFLLLAIAVVFMRNQIRPIRKLAVAAKRLGQGRDVPHFKPEGAREVRAAAQAFMDMHRRIKRQVSQRTAMLAGVSHDLRTPLTRLKLQLAMMTGSDAQDMQGDIIAMERMIDGYLDFVRGEGGEATRITDLNALFEKVILDMKRQGVDVQADIQPGLRAMIRPQGFERCLINLLTNAGKYGQGVWLDARITDDGGGKRLVIAVQDDGPGLPAGEYDAVFKPFYRVDASRNADTGGVGLGLPIAMDVVHAHGGKIWLEASAHGGLCVNMRLPI